MLTLGTVRTPQVYFAGFTGFLYLKGMTIFLDTEFSGLEQSAFLISLALVSEDGDWFYAERTDFEPRVLSQWHQDHVLPYLFSQLKIHQPDFIDRPGTFVSGDASTLLTALRSWLAPFPLVEIWADVLAYDWVLFCELFGGALHLPQNIHYIPFDFSTLLKLKNVDPDISRTQLVPEWAGLNSAMRHNALFDACLLREGYLRLK